MQHYLLDENLSRKLVDSLHPVFGNISHIANEGLLNGTDRDIWSFTKVKKSVIITKDSDFFDMSLLFGCPPKVVKLNCGNRTTEFIGNLLMANVTLLQQFAESDKCYLDIY